MKILMLSSRVPYPLTAGFRIRIYNEAKYLARDGHRVDLLYFHDDPDEYRGELRQVFSRLFCVPLSRAGAGLSLLRGIVGSRLPLQVLLYRSEAFRDRLLSIADQYDVIIGNHIRTAEYLKVLDQHKVILDLHDAISYNYWNARKVVAGPKKLLYALEYKRVLRYECAIADSFERTVIISEKDRAWLREHGADVSRMRVIPVAVRDDIAPGKKDYSRDARTLCFLGKMSYQPNIDAVRWFVREVFPALLERYPDLVFYVMGIEPPEEIQRLSRNPNIRVTGFLENPFEVMEKSMVSVVPIRNGAGIQNKVLESMMVGTPVVASSIASEGIEAESGNHLIVADTKEEFLSAVSRLIDSPEERKRIGESGRNYVLGRYSWDVLYEQWKKLIVRHP